MSTGTRALTDKEARDAIRDDLDATLFVEAAAGTGKTTELVHRIVSVLARGPERVDEIVAVTFTEKAAGELKLRLRLEIERARGAIQERIRAGTHALGDAARQAALEHALQHLEEAHVNTIHGFCAEILRERPVEAGIDPRFEVLAEAEARHLFDQTFDRWLQDVLEDPPEGVRRALRRRPSSLDEDEGPAGRLRKAAWTLAEWRDFTAPWTRPSYELNAAIEQLVRALHGLGEIVKRGREGDQLKRDLLKAQWLHEDVQSAEKVRGPGKRDHDGLESSFVDLSHDRDFAGRVRKGGHRDFAPDVTRDDVLQRHGAFVSALLSFRRDADADLAALLRDELQAPIERYQQAKARLGALDFVDLLLKARNLVRDCDGVRRDLQRRIGRVFVDEFQDTDPLQAELLLLLTADDPSQRDQDAVCPKPGKLFVVGDPKQAIYRFRRADVGTYEKVKKLIVRQTGRPVLQLSKSYRALPALQNLVNTAFEDHFDGDERTLQAEYVPLRPHRVARTDQPSVVVLPVPAPYGVNRVTKTAIESSLPAAVGAFVDWLVSKSGWTVPDIDPGNSRAVEAGRVRLGGEASRVRLRGGPFSENLVPIAPKHICLLFRRFESWGEDVTRPYVEALEARGVPHLLVGGKSFHHREEVETIKAALAAIERPDDELAVFATLRGSLFAVGDEALFDYRERLEGGSRRIDPFRVPADLPPHLSPIADALAILRRLHLERNRVTVSDTIAALLNETRAHAGFVLRRGGEQALANVLHVAELARRYEAAGGLSFRGFVERLLASDSMGEPEAPVLEEASDGVRLMTAHKAKGLEFPVVILADITAKLTGQQASRYIDPWRQLAAVRIGGWAPFDLLNAEAEEIAKDEKEGYRVAYVAATRARDLLVVPAVGDETLDDCWVSVINQAVYPPIGYRASPSPAPRCPAFGRDSVLTRPGNDPRRPETVAPGRYPFSGPSGRGRIHDDNAYDVVWWDPAVLSLETTTGGGRHVNLLDKTVDEEVVNGALAEYQAWRDSRAAAVAAGRRESLVAKTASERVRASTRLKGEAGDVQLVQLRSSDGMNAPRRPRGPAGRRYGTLVHAVLAMAPLDGDRALVAELAAQQGCLLGALPEEVESAAETVSTVMQHELIARARASLAQGGCRRETPVTWRDDDGTLVEGVVDLAFEEAEGWTVVDFKTDHDLARGLDRYRRQVALYAAIIARATGRPARGVLLRV